MRINSMHSDYWHLYSQVTNLNKLNDTAIAQANLKNIVTANMIYPRADSIITKKLDILQAIVLGRNITEDPNTMKIIQKTNARIYTAL